MKNLCYKFKNITCNISVISIVLIFHSHPVKRRIWEMIFQNTFGMIFNVFLKEALALDCQWRGRVHLLVIGKGYTTVCISLYNCYFVKSSYEPMEEVIRTLIRSPVFLMRLHLWRDANQNTTCPPSEVLILTGTSGFFCFSVIWPNWLIPIGWMAMLLFDRT